MKILTKKEEKQKSNEIKGRFSSNDNQLNPDIS